MSAKIIKISGK